MIDGNGYLTRRNSRDSVAGQGDAAENFKSRSGRYGFGGAGWARTIGGFQFGAFSLSGRVGGAEKICGGLKV